MNPHGLRRFDGWRVVVTGAGNGMGRDISRRFVDEGAQVVVADIDEGAAREHASALGPAAVPVGVDVTDAASVTAMLDHAGDALHGLDVLVNNVGVHHVFADLLDLPDTELDRMLDVNTKSLVHTTRAAVPLLRESPHASICTVASIGAVVVRPGASFYAASKAAAISLTRSLALELAPAIRVNCVLPTSTPTGLLTSAPGADPAAIEARYARNAAALPMQRLGTGDDIAAAIAFLASRDASFVTGVALPVDGGRSAGGG